MIRCDFCNLEFARNPLAYKDDDQIPERQKMKERHEKTFCPVRPSLNPLIK